jgi:hypothetical protein
VSWPPAIVVEGHVARRSSRATRNLPIQTEGVIAMCTFRYLLIFALPTLLVGCTSMGKLDSKARVASNKESYFVFGVGPEDHRVFVFPGEMVGGRFFQNTWSPAAYYGSAENGFVVGKAAANSVLAVSSVRIVKGKNSILGSDFSACDDAKTLVFDAPAGKVVYLGNLNYEFESEKSLRVTYKDDIEGARAFLTSHHPLLAEGLEPGRFGFLPTATPCTSTSIYVTTYVPSK